MSQAEGLGHAPGGGATRGKLRLPLAEPAVRPRRPLAAGVAPPLAPCIQAAFGRRSACRAGLFSPARGPKGRKRRLDTWRAKRPFGALVILHFKSLSINLF